MASNNSQSPSLPATAKPLNSMTLSKALTKPPPLSSVLSGLNAPKTQLLTTPVTGGLNGTSSATSSVSSSPSLFQQQQQQQQQQLQQGGNNLLLANSRQTTASNQSLNSDVQQQQPTINLSNSLPPMSIASQLQNNTAYTAQFYQLSQPASTPTLANSANNNGLRLPGQAPLSNSAQSLFQTNPPPPSQQQQQANPTAQFNQPNAGEPVLQQAPPAPIPSNYFQAAQVTQTWSAASNAIAQPTQPTSTAPPTFTQFVPQPSPSPQPPQGQNAPAQQQGPTFTQFVPQPSPSPQPPQGQNAPAQQQGPTFTQFVPQPAPSPQHFNAPPQGPNAPPQQQGPTFTQFVPQAQLKPAPSPQHFNVPPQGQQQQQQTPTFTQFVPQPSPSPQHFNAPPLGQTTPLQQQPTATNAISQPTQPTAIAPPTFTHFVPPVGGTATLSPYTMPKPVQQQPITQPVSMPPPPLTQPPPMGMGMGMGPPPMVNGPPPLTRPPVATNQPPPMSSMVNPPPFMGQPQPTYQQSAQSMPNNNNNRSAMLSGPPQQLVNQFNNMSISQQQQQQQQQMRPPQQQQQNRSQPQAIDLMREKKLIMPYGDASCEAPRPVFPNEFFNEVNCHADTMRCTLTSIPESQSLLSKCRLPLGLLIHPFKDLESLKVVQSSTIVRCRNCRSYINPFVHFLDNSKWRCNLCYSINDLPEEFLFDPVTKTYGDPTKRPEINSSTIEFIAPPEYTLRPPPPAMYLYLLDVSHNAINTGYLQSFCETLLENMDKLPGDSRAQFGVITYNSSIHFYNLAESLSQPRMMIYPDIEDIILPMPDSLMVNMGENKEAIHTFLQSLPNLFANTFETDSALGTALNAAYQLLKPTGGRITVMQTCLPNVGDGILKPREDTIDKDSSNLAPQSDFYKKLALDCAGVHIAVDLFMFNSLYSDLPTLSCISKYSGGEIKYYPKFHPEHNPEQVVKFCADFKRYLTRKIGFEAVMRIRCTRGLAIHTFHGNFFVRSTDLLALPNVSPDAGFGMQINIEEQLTDIVTVCFQAAVLYTSSKSERRIRIHTYCLPVTRSVNEIINGADQEAIIGLVAKMAVDRTSMNSLKEARDAMVNVAIDYLHAYSQHVTSHKSNSIISPHSLRLLPLYLLALMKCNAFKYNLHIDDRLYAMNICKTMPLKYLMVYLYPHLYALHNFDDTKVITDSYETEISIPPRLHLSSENIDRHGVYFMDCAESVYMWVGRSVSDLFLQQVFDCKSFTELPEYLYDLPELENQLSEKIRNFLAYLLENRPFGISFICFKEGSSKSSMFFQNMFDDRTDSSISYYEFLRHLNEQVKG